MKSKSDRELDLAVATKLFTFVDDPDVWSSREETWFWIHPKEGVLIGEPWTSDFHDGSYDHQWYKFCPSSNLDHAKIVLQYYHNRNKPITITNTLNSHGFNWFVRIDQANYAEAETISLAVCKAVLAQ